jgi:hypothetical protein
MKKFMLLAFFIVSTVINAQLVEIQIDSISDTSDFVESGGYKVYVDSVLTSPTHDKYLKAAFRAGALNRKYPNSNIEVRLPTARPTGAIKFFIDKSKLNNTVNLDSIYNLIDNLQSTINFQAQAINDIYIIEIPKLENKINYIDSLNSKKISTLQNRIDVLQTFFRDSIYFVHEIPIDYNLPILKGFTFDTTGWDINTSTGEFTYLDTLDVRYISFDFNRDMELGETYNITFDISGVIEGENARFSIWLYEDAEDPKPAEWQNGRVSEELSYGNGSHVFTYTVEIMSRERMAIRARNYGSPFTIKNIKIEKI